MMNKQIANQTFIQRGDRTLILDMRVILKFDDSLVSVNAAKSEYINFCKRIAENPEEYLLITNSDS